MIPHGHLCRLVSLCAGLAAVLTQPAHAVIHAFGNISVNLAEETPAPVGGSGSATFDGTYDDVSNQFTYRTVWTGLSSNVTAGHFHGPAAAGATAPPAIDLGIAGSSSGSNTGSVILSGVQETQLLTGLWYINLHTVNNSTGEVRGQLIEDAATQSFTDIALTTAAEVPAPVGAPSSVGSLDCAYNSTTQQLTFGITWSGMSSALNGMHFHSPAAVGFTAPPSVPLSGFPTGTPGSMAGSATLTSGQGSDLLAGLMYFNIHTVSNGSGEIRGQLTGGVTVPAELSVFGSH